MFTPRNPYDEFANQYAQMRTVQEKMEGNADDHLSRFLHVIGEVSDLSVLDAGCGEGYLSRVLAQRGAQVTGIDISSRLVEMARLKDPNRTITYQVADLSQPLPAYQDHFDLIASFFVLNDVSDYRGFLATLGSVLKRAGRLVLFMNNPYSIMIRGYITDYFAASDQAFPSRGLAEQGVKVHFYHRTLQDYLDASFTAGLQLQQLVDVPTPEGNFTRREDTLIPEGYHFPFFTILSFIKA
ncbi:methyltransferase [Dictyobacter sp. S3.2.2.5]|uniref:Methyltransferase n=1 Tax=Dictyobacter halimunensis TaxID=3026934 RepID=A0ABQ6FPS3_9CHLR|nr:methyltransferase [Dictyobacter sp. S3.2.2.5]